MTRPAPTVPDWLWRLNAQECTGCGICADVCTAAAIDMPRNQALPGPVDGGITKAFPKKTNTPSTWVS